MITDLRPTIWRKLDRSEVSVIGKKEASQSPDLNQYVQSVKSWEIQENLSEIVILATVNYAANSQNNFTTNYRYTISADGKLKVHYTILPTITVPTIPIVGMQMETVPSLTNLHWLGLGPFDSYPNKQSAPILGIWGGSAKSEETNGNKAIRWVEQSGATGGVRMSTLGYLEHNVSSPQKIVILSGILGRPEKGRKADESIPQLSTTTGRPFVGEFIIELK